MNPTINTSFTLVPGSLGSGKTALLLYLLGCSNQKISVLMNELGELSIDPS